MTLLYKRSGRLHKTFLVWAFVLSMPIWMMSPSHADSAATTRNIILGAVAVTAGIILYNNYEHKVAQANTVVGYTSDGGVVYGDGRVVYPNSGGVVTYLSNNGSRPCTFNGYGPRCATTHLYAYFPHAYHPACWPPGHCKQYWKEHNDKDHGNQDHGNQSHGNPPGSS